METKISFEKAADQGKAVLLLTDSLGIYLPQEFARNFVVREAELDEAMEICASGPDHEHYWDAFCEITDNGTIEGNSGAIYRLYQDGALWAIDDSIEIDWED